MSLNNYFIKHNSNEETKVRAAELTQAYHTVKHHHSFRSNDCVNKLNSTMFSDSSIALKFSSARTKQSALITGVLAPFSMKTSSEEINKSPFYGISTDASNHKAIKMFPFVVQFFDINQGIKSKLLKVASLPCETSDEISSFCLNCIDEFKLNKNSCIVFCGDNTNTNFGGLIRVGKNNVFTKLTTNLHGGIEGVGCPAYVLHNCICAAADRLSCDIEGIVVKLFSYFSIYAVRTERLKDFCERVDVEFGTILAYSKTRWLSLMPAIERILKLFDALKDFFLNKEKAPKILLTFFNNPLSEAYLWFIHSQLSIFHQGIKKIEGSTKSVMEVNDVLECTLKALTRRKEEQFLSFSVKSILKRANITQQDKINFKNEVNEFYETCLQYLKKWSVPFSTFSKFKWMLLKDISSWEQIEEIICYFNEKSIEINDTLLFDQLASLADFVSENIKEWTDEDKKKPQCHEKWVCFFKTHTRPEQNSEFLKICQYVFAIPAHNGNTERIFSLMNIQWMDERNKMRLETLSAILQVLYNFEMDCYSFYKFILDKKEVLTMAGTTAKYPQFKS
ncbi:uncharacterized protein LOC122811502 [Protopterus annectens]|uniref:uncharacterized protein LOC122811502 n=1 Tax=Protopterus annectens TaxID=7888 RepID=UPI001CFA4FD3|nr:uncharacterized protein LOC122811502 [Protopterus annectens]